MCATHDHECVKGVVSRGQDPLASLAVRVIDATIPVYCHKEMTMSAVPVPEGIYNRHRTIRLRKESLFEGIL